ncbi:transposable element Tcb1 transposase [Trichonephila clavipes]|nr:transposable element Tcb1 transposase [Trichonephila clavipes]
MSSRHHIDDFMRGRIIGKIEEGRKITDVVRSSTSLTALFHGCGSHVKLLECVVDGTGEVVLEVRRLQKTDISSYQQKGTGAPQLSRWQISFLLPQESRSPPKTVARRLRERGGLYARRPVVCVPLTRQHRTARLQWCREHHNWTEQDRACVLFSDESRFSLSSDCRRHQSGARVVLLIVKKYPGKGPISDMQYHGVDRHHDQWPHAPTCG